MKCFQTNLVDDIHIFAAFLRKNALPRRTFCSFWWKTHLCNATTKEEEEKIARANAKREMQRNTRTETLFVRVIPSSFLYRSRVHHRQQSLFLLSLSRSFHFTRNKKKSKNNNYKKHKNWQNKKNNNNNNHNKNTNEKNTTKTTAKTQQQQQQ